MWLNRQRYEELVAKAAAADAWERAATDLKAELTRERDRAERALEAMLAVRELPSVAPPPPVSLEDALPEGMFGDDPKVLAEWQKRGGDPVALLMEEGGPRE